MDIDCLRKLKNVEVEILQEIAKICDGNNLCYFLVGGTLLGAVRHRGFIPWDDDIDIAMPPLDYEKFLKICKTQLSGKYYLHCNYTDERYWLSFAKVKKNNTSFNVGILDKIDTHKGIFIDIFPLDNANKQESLFQNIQGKTVDIFTKFLQIKRSIYSDKYSLKSKVISFIIKPISMKSISSFQQKIMQFNKIENSEYFVNLGSHYNYIDQTIKKNKYFPVKKLEFEGKQFSVPNDFDFVLKRIYGDYMQLPPENKRINHNPVSIDFDK